MGWLSLFDTCEWLIGRVGRLSIRIPWKKLGWDPIIIILEDILVCASQREDEEVSSISFQGIISIVHLHYII